MSVEQADLNSPKMQDMLRKIRALKAKADDPSTTEAESLAFAAKVAELLGNYDLEEAHLNIGKEEEAAPVGHEDYVAKNNWNSSPAKRVLVMAVCKLYNVSPLVRSGQGQPWTLVGRKHNIVMVKDMTDYLIKTTVRLSSEYVKAEKAKMALNVSTWSLNALAPSAVDFRRGCFKRLAERLHDLYLETARKEQPVYNGTNPGNLPALYMHEGKLRQAYIGVHWPRAGTMRPQRVKQGYSAMAGRAAGDSISLNKQVGGAARSNYMIGKK
jgi:hypothetical protein